MHTYIERIIKIEHWKRGDKQHARTTVITQDGDEVSGYGESWQIGDKIIAFFNEKYNRAEFIKDNEVL